MNAFRLVSSLEILKIKAGTIMFLPPKSELPKDIRTPFDTNKGAFNHPVAILSCPPPKEMKHTSLVQIAIMTSFNGTAIKKHLAAKGINKRTGAEAAAFSGHLRVVTASKPFALDTLKLRNGKGMKRDFSYVGIQRTYAIQVRALALYGGVKEEVDTYCLTPHATKKLINAIDKYKEKGKANKGKPGAIKLKQIKQTGPSDGLMKGEAVQKNSLRATPKFKRVDWRGDDLNKSIKSNAELIPLVSPKSGLRPRYKTEDGVVLGSPRLTSENPYRSLNLRSYRR